MLLQPHQRRAFRTNHWLLTDVLRDEWGFEGIVMSDWGADHDRGASLNAGLNLEMPPSYTDDQIVYAVRDGRITPPSSIVWLRA